VSKPIDEGTAWDLVRGIKPGSVIETTRLFGPEGDHWVDVDPSGSWSTSHPPSDEARTILDIYVPIQLPEALVIGQMGQSLDGRIATESGSSHFVTGPEDIKRLHRLRALVDAVLVGTNTAQSDDPQLTVREVSGDNPVRVILNPADRLGSDLAVFTDDAAQTLIVRRAVSGSTRAEMIGDEVLVPELEPGSLDLTALLQALKASGLRRVLVEGGGVTVSSFLQAGLLDRLHVTVAPMLIGSGRPSITLDPIETLDAAIRPKCRHFKLGADILFDLDLR
jgi:riboflavin-specific deaminase-like protein